MNEDDKQLIVAAAQLAAEYQRGAVAQLLSKLAARLHAVLEANEALATAHVEAVERLTNENLKLARALTVAVQRLEDFEAWDPQPHELHEDELCTRKLPHVCCANGPCNGWPRP